MSVWVGFEQASVPYRRDPRHAGETKYTLSRMVRFAMDAISSFSYRPLQAATVLGFVFSIIAFLSIPVAIAFRIAGQFVPGITTVLLVVLLLGGIQLITVGIIGEYLGRVYEEVKGRPLYVVNQRLNPAPPREGSAGGAGDRT
jgi:dolichol-phosphate mannosyltransferase